MTEAPEAVVRAVFWAPVEAFQIAADVTVPPLVALGEGILAIVGATAAGVAEVWPLVALVWVGIAGYALFGWWSA